MANLTKKDFKAIADIIQTAVNQSTQKTGCESLTQVAKDLAAYCATTNPRFDRARFLNACGVQS